MLGKCSILWYNFISNNTWFRGNKYGDGYYLVYDNILKQILPVNDYIETRDTILEFWEIKDEVF